MKVEVDASEVEYGAYYTDEKCRELEGVLRGDSQYAQCEVKRAHWNDDPTDDPFYILDEKGEEVIRIERWEVYALSGSEIISYIRAQRPRNLVSGRLESLMLLSAFDIALAIAFPFLAVVFLYAGEYTMFSLLMSLSPVTLAIAVFAGIVLYSMYRKTSLQMGNIDLESVREDGSFLEILRKLAEIPDADERTRKDLVNRIRHIEDAKAGVLS